MIVRFGRVPWHVLSGRASATDRKDETRMTRKKNPPPTLTRFESAAARTHSAAKALIDAETAEREEKVQRLRKARMERDASEAMQPSRPAAKRRAPKRTVSKPADG